MCTVIIKKWKRLKSPLAAEMLSGKFPKCGIKYTSKYEGSGLIIAKYHASIGDIIEKALVAGDKAGKVHIFIIPKEIEIAAGI